MGGEEMRGEERRREERRGDETRRDERRGEERREGGREKDAHGIYVVLVEVALVFLPHKGWLHQIRIRLHR